MYKLLTTIIIFCICFYLYPQHIENGTYIGYEPMKFLDSETGNVETWYHENVLLIYNDSLNINASPLRILGKDTIYSASDGIFFYWKGIIEEKNNQLFAKITLVDCDYGCARDEHGKIIPVILEKSIYKVDSQIVIFGNVKYKKKK